MTKKFLTPIAPPALATDPSVATPGAIYYNSATGKLRIYSGSSWGNVATGVAVLPEPPTTPALGELYFDTSENTFKGYNGQVWYDVAGPKEILEHTHSQSTGIVEEVTYGEYVDDSRIFASSGTASSSFIDTYIDGGNASGN
jgi:hypothetical protein